MKNVTFQERKVLLESLKESNNGDKERTMIDLDLIEGSIALMRTHSILPQKKRGFRVTLNEQIENLLDLAYNKELALGKTLNPVVLDVESVKSIISDYTFTYKKSKGTSKKRIHTDKYTVTANDEESAIANLKFRLKKLKETLISIDKISRKHYSYEMEDGSIVLRSDVVDYIQK